MAALALAMVAASVILLIPNSTLPAFATFGSNGWGGLVFSATFPAAGWLIISRRPDNRIGWIFLGAGFFQGLEAVAGQYAAFGLYGHPGTVPLAAVASWVITWAWVPGLLLLFTALLLFPDGRLYSSRWRVVLWLIGVTFVLIFPPTFIAMWPYRGTALMPDELPPAIAAVTALPMAIAQIGKILLLPIAALTGAGVVVRFRRATGIERQQLKWFTSAAAVQIVVLILTSAASLPPPYDLIVAVLTWPLIPIAVAIAVLRYRLYEIDIVIRRTLVYVPLTALLAGIYAASIGISQRLFVAVTGNTSDGAIILSTLILASAFTPIKNAIQGRVDRGFREVQDAERRLMAFTQAIEDDWSAPDPARAIRAFLASAITAVRASGGEAWIEAGPGERSVGSSLARIGAPIVHVPVEIGGRRFGRLELDAHARGREYSDGDLASLRAAGERLAATLSGPSHGAPLQLRPTGMPSVVAADAVE